MFYTLRVCVCVCVWLRLRGYFSSSFEVGNTVWFFLQNHKSTVCCVSHMFLPSALVRTPCSPTPPPACAHTQGPHRTPRPPPPPRTLPRVFVLLSCVGCACFFLLSSSFFRLLPPSPSLMRRLRASSPPARTARGTPLCSSCAARTAHSGRATPGSGCRVATGSLQGSVA